MQDKDIQPQAEPYIVKSHDIHIDADYADWIADIKSRYRSAQVKAAVKVNAEKLLFNWQLGRDLVQKKAEERWGAGVVEQVSLDLKQEFPDADGFSTSNLWYMKKWYLFYTDDDSEGKLQRAVGELQKVENQYITKLHQVGAELSNDKLHQVGGEFPLPFALVPWRHHVEIITKAKTIEEALFYIGKTIEQGLSRDALINCIKAMKYMATNAHVAKAKPQRTLAYVTEDEKAGMLPDDLVMVAIAGSEEKRQWTFENLWYNIPLDKIADSPWNQAKYLLLHVKGEKCVGNLCKIVRTKHDVWTKERLIQSNYPSEPHNSSYFMIRIRKPSDTDAELQKLQFNVKDIPNKY